MILPYGPLHHAVFQFLLTHKAITHTQLVEVLSQLYRSLFTDEQDVVTQDAVFGEILDGVLESLNLKLTEHKLGFAIRKRRSQLDGQVVVLFVNIQVDEAAKVALTLGEVEIAVLNAAIDYMFNNEDGEETYAIGMGNLHALVRQQSAKSTYSATVGLATTLIQQGWLLQSTTQKLTLSDLALCELQESLVEKYGLALRTGETPPEDDPRPFSIHLCPACDQIVTMGQKSSSSCPVRFHAACVARYTAARGTACPSSSCQHTLDNEGGITVGVAPDLFHTTAFNTE